MDTGIDLDHPDLGGDGNAGGTASVPELSRDRAAVDLVGDDYNADRRVARLPADPAPRRGPGRLQRPRHARRRHRRRRTAPGPNGAKGVAPGVSFGAYRVFGCDGSVTDDVMIAAMEAALADGMEVLNMSIGDAFNNWPGSPTAAAADALVDAGMVVVASIGNSGAERRSIQPALRASETRSSASRRTTTRTSGRSSSRSHRTTSAFRS